MKVVFWISLIGLLYTYIGYPAVMWVWSRLWPRPWRTGAISPSVSIVLAVHNGLEMLPAKIEHLLHLDYPEVREVIAVSDGSTDGTAEWLEQNQDPALKVIVLKEHAGKAVAVNAGMNAATGDVLLFVDIRPEIAPGAIQQLVSNFADPKVGCVCGHLALRHAGHDAAASAVGGLYWRYEQWIRTCEALCDSPVGVYGGFYAIRRELATQQPAGTILDDMFQPLSIVRKGYRTVLEPRATVYDTWPTKVSGEFHRKVRTLAGNFQLIQLAPWTLTFQNRVIFQFVSHKLMRLIAPYLMVVLLIAMLALSPTSSVYAEFAAAQVAALMLAIAGLRLRIPILHRIAAPLSALFVLNVAAVVGLYRFLFAPRPLWRIWTSHLGTNKDRRPALSRLLPGKWARK